MLVVGKIVGSHGIQGAVRLKSFTEKPETLFSFPHLLCETDDRTFKVKTHKPTKDPAVFLVRFEGVTSRNDADALKGTVLCIPEDMLPDLGKEEDVFYHKDLIGMKAQEIEQGWTGTLCAIHRIGESDVLEVKPDDGKASCLIPFTQHFVPEVRLKEGLVLFRAWDKGKTNSRETPD